MAQRYQLADAQLGHSRTNILTGIALGVVVLTAVGSGLMYGMHSGTKQLNLSSDQAQLKTATAVQKSFDKNVDATSAVKAETLTTTGDASTAPSPDAAAATSGSTQVALPTNGSAANVNSDIKAQTTAPVTTETRHKDATPLRNTLSGLTQGLTNLLN